MKTMMRGALPMIFFLFFSQATSAEQYGCQATSSDFRTLYITSLFDVSSEQSAQLQAQWKDYVASQYGGGMQTLCSVGGPAAYNQAIPGALGGGQSVQIINWLPEPAPAASEAPGSPASSSNAKKIATAPRTPGDPGSKAIASRREYRDGTTCIRLEPADGNGVGFWKNNCSFPVSISWADEQCTSGFACGASLNIKPGGKDAVIVTGRYTAAACEYPGVARNLDGERWQPGDGQHSCK